MADIEESAPVIPIKEKDENTGHLRIKFAKLHPDAIIPNKTHKRDAGLDFYALEDGLLASGESLIIPTGIAWQPIIGGRRRTNIFMQIKSRSSFAFKYDIESTNAGVIDYDYRGEIKILLRNYGHYNFEIKKGMKIAQGIIKFIPLFNVEEIDASKLSKTTRGNGGFGSTGM